MSRVPARYRKRPVVIDALLFDGGNGADVADWSGGTVDEDRVMIPTIEGDLTASPGDYVIRGVAGEFYPCKPDIFAATYEPTGEPARSELNGP